MKKNTRRVTPISFAQRLLSFVPRNITLLIVCVGVFFVAIIVMVRFFSPHRSNIIYAKVKLSSGPWWSRGGKPGIWYVNALSKSEGIEYDIAGNNKAQLIKLSYFPWPNSEGYYTTDEYDVYIQVRLAVGYNKRTRSYVFKDTAVSVGSPITLEFSDTLVTGTVIDLSEKNFNDKYEFKTVILSKKYSFPWEYDAIEIGERFQNGGELIAEVQDKWYQEHNYLIRMEREIVNSSTQEERGYQFIKVKMRLKRVRDEWFLGEEQVVRKGKTLGFAFPSFSLGDYRVIDIQ